MIKRWLQLAIVLVALSIAFARPNDVYPVYRSLESAKESSSLDITSTTQEPAVISTTLSPDNEKLTIDDIATVARASNEVPSLNPSVAKVTDQLMGTLGQMVDKDIRTPPKLKEVIKEKNETEATTTATILEAEKVEANGRFKIDTANISEGKANSPKNEEVGGIKGVAVPVIMDEEVDVPPKKLQKLPNLTKPKDEKKKIAPLPAKLAREPATTTPSSGLSTWILLSDNRVTTPSNKQKKTTTTTKKPNKSQGTTVKPTTIKIVRKTTPKPEKKAEISALETMVKIKQTTTTASPNLKKKVEGADAENNKKVVTIPPAILVETTESASNEGNTETSVETTTEKKKKSSTKKRKNKKKKKKPAEKSGADQIIKDLVKQPKQPVGAQFYNFLSREIMPTVGLGLVGVLVTAGLAGLLGYNPFVGANIPVRRTYESQHGYHPNSHYYNYNNEYNEPEGGKNEEVLFREVLSGMPEDSRYGMPQADVSYPETQLYNSQEQAYDVSKNPNSAVKQPDSYSNVYNAQYDAYTSKEEVGKFPVYSGGAYQPYQESSTEKFKASAKYSEEDPIEKQPEALYRVSSDYSADASDTESTSSEQTAWHRIGSPLDYSSQAGQVSYMEPGPRKLDLDKMTKSLTDGHKRTKRSPEGILARIVRRSNEVVSNFDDSENEIDSNEVVRASSSTESPVSETTTAELLTESSSLESSTMEAEKQPDLMESFPTTALPATDAPPSLMDVLRRLAQFKLRLGISFLKATTDAFGRYLEGVQQRVEDSMANDTSYPATKYTWSGREVAPMPTDDSVIREKRFQREVGNVDENNNEWELS